MQQVPSSNHGSSWQQLESVASLTSDRPSHTANNGFRVLLSVTQPSMTSTKSGETGNTSYTGFTQLVATCPLPETIRHHLHEDPCPLYPYLNKNLDIKNYKWTY